MDELVEEPRLADPGLADDRHHLAAAAARLLGGGPELIHLGVAAHEAGEAARGGRLQPRARGAGPDQLVDFNGLAQPLHRDRPQRLHLDPALGQAQRLGGEPDAAGSGELLHARGQVRRLPDRRVVHAQVAPDRADDDLARVHADADLDLDPCVRRSPSVYRRIASCIRSAA